MYVAKCHFCHKLLTEAQLFEVCDDKVYASCVKCADEVVFG